MFLALIIVSVFVLTICDVLSIATNAHGNSFIFGLIGAILLAANQYAAISYVLEQIK